MSDNREHPVRQKIEQITFSQDGGDSYFTVGKLGVTKIEATTKSGMHSNIPYIRVWSGDMCIAEFCQHGLLGVFYSDEPEQEIAA